MIIEQNAKIRLHTQKETVGWGRTCAQSDWFGNYISVDARWSSKDYNPYYTIGVKNEEDGRFGYVYMSGLALEDYFVL